MIEPWQFGSDMPAGYVTGPGRMAAWRPNNLRAVAFWSPAVHDDAPIHGADEKGDTALVHALNSMAGDCPAVAVIVRPVQMGYPSAVCRKVNGLVG